MQLALLFHGRVVGETGCGSEKAFGTLVPWHIVPNTPHRAR
jgi:hypothetical protein